MKFVGVVLCFLALQIQALLTPDASKIRDEARKTFFQNLQPTTVSSSSSSSPSPLLTSSAPQSSFSNYPLNQTVFVLADLHGDFLATTSLLYAGGLIDRNGRWTGGSSLVVQLGDIADRGPDSPAIYELFWRLADEARRDGGDILQVFGNHEVMNLMGQTHYVSTREMKKYFQGNFKIANDVWNPLRGALGERIMNSFNVTHKIGDLLFVHAGLLPEFSNDLAEVDMRLKTAIRAFSQGDVEQYNRYKNTIEGDLSPVWTRQLTHTKSEKARCKLVAAALNKTDITHQFVGHTPTQSRRVETYCDNSFIQTDTGNSRWMYDSQTLIRIQIAPRNAPKSIIQEMAQKDIIEVYDRTFDELHIKQLPQEEKDAKIKPLLVEWLTLFSDEVCYQGSKQIHCTEQISKNDEL